MAILGVRITFKVPILPSFCHLHVMLLQPSASYPRDTHVELRVRNYFKFLPQVLRYTNYGRHTSRGNYSWRNKILIRVSEWPLSSRGNLCGARLLTESWRRYRRLNRDKALTGTSTTCGNNGKMTITTASVRLI